MRGRFSVSVFLTVYLQVPISGNNVGSWAGITVLSCLEPWTATNTGIEKRPSNALYSD